MQARQVAVKPWHKTCSRCKKPVFQDLLDEQGLCEYCRAIVAMKTSSKKNGGRSRATEFFFTQSGGGDDGADIEDSDDRQWR